MCQRAGHDQSDLESLLAALDQDIDRNVWYDADPARLDVSALAQAASGCPACMLAAVRKRDAATIMFDYQYHHDAFWEGMKEHDE